MHEENGLTSVERYAYRRQRSKTENSGYGFHFIEVAKYYLKRKIC